METALKKLFQNKSNVIFISAAFYVTGRCNALRCTNMQVTSRWKLALALGFSTLRQSAKIFFPLKTPAVLAFFENSWMATIFFFLYDRILTCLLVLFTICHVLFCLSDKHFIFWSMLFFSLCYNYFVFVLVFCIE